MWLFRQLLRLYPAGFRAEYGDVMQQQFSEDWREANGVAATAVLIGRSVSELLWMWPQIVAEELGQDVRYCWRSWCRRFGVTALAVLSLGMAIGVSTGVFSVLNATLYRSLPFRQPERLVHFDTYFAPVFQGPQGYQKWLKSHTFLKDGGVFSSSEYSLNHEPNALRVKAAETTSNFFRFLGARLFAGRDFAPEEELKGKGAVAVISYGLFEQAFGGNLQIIGQPIELNGRKLTVIGVAAASFDYPHNAALWTPTVFDLDAIPKSGVSMTTTIGRLRDGLSIAEAQAGFRVISPRYRDEFFGSGPNDPQPKMRLMREELAGPIGKATQVLFAGVCAVLLIACANLAHLCLSRFGERGVEFRIRGWLGAGGARITQQILTECVLLSLAAGLVGLGFAQFVTWIGAYYFPPVFAFQNYDVLEWQVLLFAFGVSLACGLVFGLAPVLLRGRSVARTNRVRMLMLGAQVGLTAALLLGSIDLGNSLLRLYQTDLGYKTARVETATMSLAGSVYETEVGRREFASKCLEAVGRLQGVEQVGMVDFLPLSSNSFMAGRFRVQSSKDAQLGLLVRASSGFVESIGGTLLAGRDFTATDLPNSQPVVIVNESFAKLDGGVASVVGHKLRNEDEPKDKAATIIGVVKDFKFAGPAEEGFATVILPISQKPSNFFTVTAKPKAGEPSVARQLKQALENIDKSVPVYDVMPFSRRLDRALARPNFYVVVLLFFGGFSLLLTVVHGYSLCSNTLEQRKREIGIRSALGATPGQLRWMILREMLPALGLGLLVGVMVSFYSDVALRELMEGVKMAPLLWRGAGVATLALTAGLTIWIKTRGLLCLSPADQIRFT